MLIGIKALGPNLGPAFRRPGQTCAKAPVVQALPGLEATTDIPPRRT
jgi:hypothetical protein